MTQDEIIELAKQADVWVAGQEPYQSQLEAFAKLVADKEREACANVAKQISDKYGWGYYGNEVDTADEIEKAIRARGQA